MDVDSVRLEPGVHRTPREGVCLLELVSLMAEERFSDRPRCVCVVIAAFLRSWNDRSGHAERQALRPYARRVLGSRSRRGVTGRRRDICLTWAGADLTGNWASRAIRRIGMRLRILTLLGVRPALRLNEGAGELASRVVFSRYTSETGLRLVDTLLEVGNELEPATGALGDADGDALARAVVESALRSPVPLANGGHGQSNGNGASRNGNGTAHAQDAEREPAKTG
jgi:hypothetical protein